MKYMIVEHYKPGKVKALYERFEKKGRQLPNEVIYLDSWIDDKVEKCFQLMKAESLDRLLEWTAKWNDLVDFKIYPVIDSAIAKHMVLKEVSSSIEKNKIRLAAESDATAISKLLEISFEEFRKQYTEDAYRATCKTDEEVKDRLVEGPVWLVYDSNRLIGTLSGFQRANYFYLRGMAVHPLARGKKVAKELLLLAEYHARHLNCTSMRLSTSPYLKSACRLYEKFGFEIINEGPYDLYGTPLFNMEKILSS